MPKIARFLWVSALASLTAALVALAPGAAAAAAAALKSFRDCPACPEMTVLPAGDFLMGSPASEIGRGDSESLPHLVRIAHPFAIARRDVTRAEYAVFVRQTGYVATGARCDWENAKLAGQPLHQGPDEPVVCVSWADAQAYVHWLSARTHRPYRLPEESEWEYAARAGSRTARPWGEAFDPNLANVGADNCCGPHAAGADRWLYTSPVGAFPANAFGLFDMIGDVWQWTDTCAKATAPGSPQDCAGRVVRGGGWFHPPAAARSASRAEDEAGHRVADIGFRVALSLQP